ncbi:DinB family protein [Tunturibacter empetritectus]|uniref:Damage-inducible protein DinB n=1 Tax=Tunturiibacter lichenicola TaxID=2051959 RepID=A0A7W8N392_9BACT|nr:DinB family protein [Edaphobacter lichenicola]MBB5343218.1 putative damage-inducible protein DinB [Edaphobacter lichenicola]
MVEPWLRGTLTEFDALRRQVLHALELAQEDVERWCAGLSDSEMNARPSGIAPVAFHLRHIARSLDRLLTYAEGRALSEAQMDALRSEMESGASAKIVLDEVRAGLKEARQRVLMISQESYEESRGVGRSMLPSTVGGLLVHCAEHTQRHIGQAITTAKVVMGARA